MDIKMNKVDYPTSSHTNTMYFDSWG